MPEHGFAFIHIHIPILALSEVIAGAWQTSWRPGTCIGSLYPLKRLPYSYIDLRRGAILCQLVGKRLKKQRDIVEESQQVQEYILKAVLDGLKEVSAKPSTSRNRDPLSGNQELSPHSEHNVGEVVEGGGIRRSDLPLIFVLVPEFVSAVKQAIAWEEEPSQPPQKMRK